MICSVLLVKRDSLQRRAQAGLVFQVHIFKVIQCKEILEKAQEHGPRRHMLFTLTWSGDDGSSRDWSQNEAYRCGASLKALMSMWTSIDGPENAVVGG